MVLLKCFSGRFEPYPSIWKSLMNLKFGSKNAFLNLNWKIFDLWVKSKLSVWKSFFEKVPVIGYIFHIYHMCSKWILMELRAFEATCKIVVFYQNHLWKYCLRVHGKDSNGRTNLIFDSGKIWGCKFFKKWKLEKGGAKGGQAVMSESTPWLCWKIQIWPRKLPSQPLIMV